MALEPGSLAGVLEAVPVFPLPGLVFFPEQRLPLHIFEPRYRAMVRDVLGSGTPYLVVSQCGPEPHLAPPPFAAVSTLGKIVAHQRLSDGRFNILVEGLLRVRLEELPFVPPYRRAKAAAVPEPDPYAVSVFEREALVALATQLVTHAREKNAHLDGHLPLELSPSRLALRVVERFVKDPALRQKVLQSDSAAERVAWATEALAARLHEVGALGGVGDS
ncbi:MAG: LON peptidase substrate-binding domain-containing protein [Myxococcales bacterium]|nr:LON peptidase substrate-binding domain-containing protein [Myxococcales bacterium]